jgi:hypothetical protein
MLEQLLIAPSFNSLVVTGLILLFTLLLFIQNRKEILNLSYYKLIKLSLLTSLAIGVHGLLHLGTESVYGFNPYKLF